MKLTAESTVFNDDKVQEKFAELVVDADGIRTEVGKKVGNTEVISRINQSAESVKIQADKINIDGVITAVNDNTTTTIDGDKITTGTLLASAVKADSGTFNTANIPNLSAEKITSGTLDAARIGATSIGADKIKVDEIQIGAAQIASGTIDTARIPNLDASKITAGTISDASGKNSWNLSTGQFVTQQGQIADMTINTTGLIYDHTNTYMNWRDLFRIYAGELGIRTLRGTANTGYLNTGVDVGAVLGIQFYYDTTEPSDPWTGMTKTGSIFPLSNGFAIDSAGGASIHVIPDSVMISSAPLRVFGNFYATGSKSRVVNTENYSDRELYCYETPTPLFGDIGEAFLDEDGICYVDIDDIFGETIADNIEYQVFLQKESDGDCWVLDKQPRYFIIKGTPNIKVAWELKAKQRNYETQRLEQFGLDLDEYERITDVSNDYIKEQEDLLYGNY